MLEENNKRKILEILQEEFPLHEEIHMAKIGKYLHEHGNGPDAYGYKKMKKFMQNLKEIMNLQERIMNGVPQTIIMLHEYEEVNVPHYSDLQIEKMQKEQQKQKEQEEKIIAEAAAKAEADANTAAKAEANGNAEVKVVAKVVANAEDNAEAKAEDEAQNEVRNEDNEYPRRFQDFAFIPNKVLGHLERMASARSMEGRSAAQVLEEAYERAVEEKSLEVGKQHVQLFTGVYTDHQEPLYATLSPNKIATNHKWALTYIHVPERSRKDAENAKTQERESEKIKNENHHDNRKAPEKEILKKEIHKKEIHKKEVFKQEAFKNEDLKQEVHKKEVHAEKTHTVDEVAVAAQGNSLLDKDVLLPDKTVNLLHRFVREEDLQGKTPKEFIIDAYDRASRANDVYEQPDMFGFPLYVKSTRGENLNAVCRLNRYPNQQKWALTYIGSDDPKTPIQPKQRRAVPGHKLEQYAEIGNWNAVLQELAEMALPEQWDFASEAEKSYYILKQYLCYTFYRLEKEGKICVSAAGDFAAFNTGLVSRMYEDIYACFVPNEESGSHWKLDGFCVAGERGNGKLLVKYFSPLPQAAKYFDELKDLLYDPERQLIADYNHILIENMDRLPIEFIIQECYSDKRAVRLATQAGQENNLRQRRRLFKELAHYISEQPRLVTRLRNRLDDAIELAIKQCRWNYKTALPLYYPKGNCMSLMLPLSLQDDEKADVAFVVQLTESGNYQGQTILTLAQAYLDARLLCRLNNEWLNTEKVIGLMDLEDADDIGTMMEY